jgi:hypothetical protein
MEWLVILLFIVFGSCQATTVIPVLFQTSMTVPYMVPQTYTNAGFVATVQLQSIPSAPTGSSIESWFWSLDASKTGQFPSWLLYLPPATNQSNSFGLQFTGIASTTAPMPFYVYLQGRVTFRRMYLVSRGQGNSSIPLAESQLQSVTLMTSLIPAASPSSRFSSSQWTIVAATTTSGTIFQNKVAQLSTFTLQESETVQLSCSTFTNAECLIGTVNQITQLAPSSLLWIQSGQARFITTTYILGTVVLDPGVSITFQSSGPASVLGRLPVGFFCHGMLNVNSGILFLLSPFQTSNGGFNVAPGATLIMNTLGKSSIATSGYNNGGLNYVNGELILLSGTLQLLTPLQGIGQITIYDSALLWFDGIKETNPTIVTTDPLTGQVIWSRTTHALVRAEMVSPMFSQSFVNSITNNGGRLRISALCRVVSYRPIQNLQGLVLLDPDAQLIFDTASAPVSVLAGFDGISNAGSIFIISGSLQISTSLRSSGNFEMGLNTMVTFAPMSGSFFKESVIGGQALLSAGILLISSIVRFVGPLHSFSVVIVDSTGSVYFGSSFGIEKHQLDYYGLYNSGSLEMQSLILLNGPLQSNGTIRLVQNSSLEFNHPRNESIVGGGGGVVNDGGTMIVSAGSRLIIAGPPGYQDVGTSTLVIDEKSEFILTVVDLFQSAQHNIGDIFNEGQLIILNCTARFLGRLQQMYGQLQSCCQDSFRQDQIVFSHLGNVIGNSTLGSISFGSLLPVVIESSGSLSLVDGSTSGIMGGLLQSGVLQLENAARLQVQTFWQGLPGPVSLNGTSLLNGTTGGSSAKTSLLDSSILSVIENCQFQGGLLEGIGGIISSPKTILGNVLVSPGFGQSYAIGSLTINGDLFCSEKTIVRTDILGRANGTSYDQIIVNGTAMINGKLIVSSANSSELFPLKLAPKTSNLDPDNPIPRAALFPIFIGQTVIGEFPVLESLWDQSVLVTLRYTAQACIAIVSQSSMALYLSSSFSLLSSWCSHLFFASGLILLSLGLIHAF